MFVLDTNAIVAIVLEPKRFGKRTRKLTRTSPELYFSTVSVFEIAMKQMRGKFKVSTPIPELLSGLQAKPLDLRIEDASEIYSFPSLIRHDPFDRLILATAKANGAKLIT